MPGYTRPASFIALLESQLSERHAQGRLIASRPHEMGATATEWSRFLVPTAGSSLSDLLRLGRGIHSMHQGHVDQVLAQKPDLKFIAAQNFADHEIVGSIVTEG